MTIEEFKAYLRAKPFRPFTVYLADGRKIRIEHPEFVAQSPGGRTVVVHGGDHIESIDLLLVTNISNASKPRTRRAS